MANRKPNLVPSTLKLKTKIVLRILYTSIQYETLKDAPLRIKTILKGFGLKYFLEFYRCQDENMKHHHMNGLFSVLLELIVFTFLATKLCSALFAESETEL